MGQARTRPAARRERAAIKSRLKASGGSIREVIDSRATSDAVAKMKVTALLESMPQDPRQEILVALALPGLVVAVVVSLVTPSTDPEIQAEFERMEHELADGRGDIDLARQG